MTSCTLALLVLLFGILAIQVKRYAPNAHTICEIIDARWGATAHKVFLFFCFLTNIIVSSLCSSCSRRPSRSLCTSRVIYNSPDTCRRHYLVVYSRRLRISAYLSSLLPRTAYTASSGQRSLSSQRRESKCTTGGPWGRATRTPGRRR